MQETMQADGASLEKEVSMSDRSALAGSAMDILAERFPQYDWTYHETQSKPGESGREYTFHWFGDPDEEVMVCVHKGGALQERFHRHDFYFFNYAYQGDYQALSADRQNLITIREGELYLGQPYSGYALRGNPDSEIAIVGVLVKKGVFYREFLPALAAEPELSRFYLDPQSDAFSDLHRHLKSIPPETIRPILDVMMIEYAKEDHGSQKVLKPLALALAEIAARQYGTEHPNDVQTIQQKLSAYIEAHLADASLEGAASELGFHPNYLSALIRRETGSTFRDTLSLARMERSALLISGTDLTIEEVASMMGYASTSNFYRAYRKHFGHSPRE